MSSKERGDCPMRLGQPSTQRHSRQAKCEQCEIAVNVGYDATMKTDDVRCPFYLLGRWALAGLLEKGVEV